jgi:hypothetical protein
MRLRVPNSWREFSARRTIAKPRCQHECVAEAIGISPVPRQVDMKQLRYLIIAASLSACDIDSVNVFPEDQIPSPDFNLVGTWTGFEEISTVQDIATNTGSPADRGYNFPIVVTLQADNRFTLFTSGYPTSFENEFERTCIGIYTQQNRTISFFPNESCRALPMTKYVLGAAVPNAITLSANSNSVGNPAANYLTMRVFMRLERE